MVRLLILLILFNVQSTLAKASTYLTPVEKASVSLILKAGNDVGLLSELAQKVYNSSLQLPQVEVVDSFEQFIEKQKSLDLFDHYSLEQISYEQLYPLLKSKKYLSTSSKVQNKIDIYVKNRDAQIKRMYDSVVFFSLASLRQADFDSVKGFKQSMTAQLETTIEHYSAQLSQSQTAQSVMLAKIIKLYFKALPSGQKAEIFYRLIQLPLDSKPMEIFLTMIQNSGPQLQKLVQIVGRRDDIPEDFKLVFQKLESQVKPVPWWQVVQLLKAEKINLNDFTYFEKKPLGVGTMAQTHRAQLKGAQGERNSIVVRFLKPDIETKLAMDHEILSRISLEIDSDPDLKKFQLPSLAQLVDDLHGSIAEELHLDQTLKNQGRAKTVYTSKEIFNYANQKNEISFQVPSVHLFGENSKLMSQDLVFGKKPAKEFGEYAVIYPDLYRAVSEKVAELWIEQAFFKSGFFHADLHQGNILASVSDHEITVNILDFGMTGELNRQLRESALLVSLGIKLENSQLIAKHFLNLAKADSKQLSYVDFLKLVKSKVQQNKQSPQAEQSLEAWTLWALDQGLELHYEFLKLNRGLAAIQSMMQDSKSVLTFEGLAQTISLRNKKYFSQLILKEPLLKTGDYSGILGLLLPQKQTQAAPQILQCRKLFSP